MHFYISFILFLVNSLFCSIINLQRYFSSFFLVQELVESGIAPHGPFGNLHNTTEGGIVFLKADPDEPSLLGSTAEGVPVAHWCGVAAREASSSHTRGASAAPKGGGGPANSPNLMAAGAEREPAGKGGTAEGPGLERSWMACHSSRTSKRGAQRRSTSSPWLAWTCGMDS